MKDTNFLNFDNREKTILILDKTIPLKAYTPINLSITNKALHNKDITKPDLCQHYINEVLQQNNALVAYGGYLEQRNLYTSSSRFSKDKIRNIHLGIDFWCTAGTNVIVPLEGKVHSFQNNKDIGNYGPTIILEHKVNHILFYSLYGHLSIASLKGLYIGKVFKEGEVLASLGTPDINVNYAPHLHFQIIKTIGNYLGDYPGVCHHNDLDFYKDNCPNPNLLLKL